MKTLNFGGECVCGHHIKALVPRPKPALATLVKLECHGCKSQFMLRASVERARPGGIRIAQDIKILFLSKVAEGIVKADLLSKREAKIFFIPFGRENAVYSYFLLGHTPSEIASAFGCSERIINRLIDRAKKKFKSIPQPPSGGVA